ncbi:DNA alkylation repair protein [bacterium]|nr:DNA alkylation repair protein [bacterium]
MNINEIKNELKNIKRTSFGISIPELRKFAKRIAKKDYLTLFNDNDFDTFEIKLLHAFTIGYVNEDIETLLKYFEKFIPYVNDWAVNDSLCQNFRIARKYPEQVWNMLMKYKNSKKEFESRIVSVTLLSHFLNDEYIDRVFEILNELNTDDYYSQMGIAWAIATAMGKYPKQTEEYLKSDKNKLDKTTYNKALQKIRESLKVPSDIKEMTKTLKK